MRKYLSVEITSKHVIPAKADVSPPGRRDSTSKPECRGFPSNSDDSYLCIHVLVPIIDLYGSGIGMARHFLYVIQEENTDYLFVHFQLNVPLFPQENVDHVDFN